ncbi:SET domain-containing protein [Serendipita vermifera]|nr:SET domain-containing protein [Serendipita vermifera]
MDQTPPPYTLGAFQNLGQGWVATRLIPQGTVILEEEPSLIATDTIPSGDIEYNVARWSPEWQNRFWSLEIAGPFQHEGPYRGRFQTNSLPIGFTNDSQPLAGLFMNGSWFHHSCQPNVIQRWSSPRMTFRALRNIHPNEPLCIAYDMPGLLYPRNKRRERLRRSAGFDCQCTVCNKPDQDSDQRRNWLRQVIEAGFITHTEEQGQRNLNTIRSALQHLQKEELYHFRDTLYYDGYRVSQTIQAIRNRNNAMLWPEAEEWLRLAYNAAVTVAGEHDQRVQEIRRVLETREVLLNDQPSNYM